MVKVITPNQIENKLIKKQPRLFYYLKREQKNKKVCVNFLKANIDQNGVLISIPDEWDNLETAIAKPPQYFEEIDLKILRKLFVQNQRDQYGYLYYPLYNAHGFEILHDLLKSGRLVNERKGYQKYTLGEVRDGTLEWKTDNERLSPIINTILACATTIPCEPICYVDDENMQIGPIKIDISARILQSLLNMPPLTPKEAGLVASVFADKIPNIPMPEHRAEISVIDARPIPQLVLDTMPLPKYDRYYLSSDELDYAQLVFKYDDVTIPIDFVGEFVKQGEKVIRIKRQRDIEAKIIKSLPKFFLNKMPSYWKDRFFKNQAGLFYLADQKKWPHFISQVVPMLQQEGWKIEITNNFRHYSLEVESWQAEISETESGWFSLDMGIIVDGERIPLTPLLANLFRRDARWLDLAKISQIRDDEILVFYTDDRKQFTIASERLKPLARTLIDLFDSNFGSEIKFSKFDIQRVEEFLNQDRWQFKGEGAIYELVQKLKVSSSIKPIAAPASFSIKLRDYQQEGLGWLQYLREHDLAGILADDMGLGKTAQALAHILVEKEAGRLTKPALIVLPTSLIFNWRNEAKRFTPTLSVLILHGTARKEQFEHIDSSDIVLTTYPLLWRDHKEISQHEFYYLILDEAQMVKNSQSRAAGVIRQLKAKHRLSITGTPLENNLGELWSQFDFLLPGFLGDKKSFNRIWRTPIEKHGDNLRREVLAKRVKPFILRRAKEDVAKELPKKSTIIRTIELEGSQRDLYETVRSSMDKKIREAIALNGFNKSRIVILDALLKLRQVCCDPRLVKSTSASKVKERAKMTLLMDMVKELIEEGRRILIFSQFAEMLKLIEEELNAATIPYAMLTGKTRNREKQINLFQEGEVSVFLISLKAGGVGLNLTAADTVIHYDPWWNPAVENQATDRAHRLGQDKPVFVYKLIVEGSIEERILALQAKKAQLAAAILSQDSSVEVKFGEDDLQALLAPLSD